MKANKNIEQTWFWNIRFFLITLVVIGNLIEPAARQSQAAGGLFLWIFSFHIPVFAFVMGHYSKRFTLNEDGLKQLLVIGMQYVLFQTIYSAADYFIFHTPGVQYSFFIPFSLLWFLMAHMFWKMLLIPFRRLRHPLLWAVLLGAAVGYVSFTLYEAFAKIAFFRHSPRT